MSRRARGPEAPWAARFGAILSLVTLIALPGDTSGRDGDDPGPDDTIDCGMTSLGTLLLIEGHPMQPERVLAALGGPSASGSSLEELRDAAAACGLRLEGVRLNKDERAIDRPMIIFLKRPRHGHYQVIRPVGHTGRLVQVIDPNWPPSVLDKASLMQSPEWTAIALVPARPPGWPVRIASGLIGGIAMAGMISIVPLLRRLGVRRSLHGGCPDLTSSPESPAGKRHQETDDS